VGREEGTRRKESRSKPKKTVTVTPFQGEQMFLYLVYVLVKLGRHLDDRKAVCRTFARAGEGRRAGT